MIGKNAIIRYIVISDLKVPDLENVCGSSGIIF